MNKLNKEYIISTLLKEQLWKTGETDTLQYNEWELTLRKEEEIYKPFAFSIQGKKINKCGTIGRRYTSMQEAFLHILNNFNENVNIKNKYKTISDYILK